MLILSVYLQPLFFAGFFWGSFAVTFNSIFHLRNAPDPANSRAPYTYRVYQVVELFFFIALIWSIEKILIRYISLNFHAVAYADRLRNNAFALNSIDKLKSYRPKRNKKTGAGHSGFNTPSAFRVGFGGVTTVSDGYFSSHAIGRSRGNTPPFTNSPQMTSPTIPGAPEPSHQSLWSRLPMPPTFRPSHGRGHHQSLSSMDNAIPLQVTAQHSSEPRRNIAGYPNFVLSQSPQQLHQTGLSTSQPDSTNARLPTKPGGHPQMPSGTP